MSSFLELKIENLTQLKAAHDPALVNKALKTAVNKSTAKAKTLVSRSVRENYTVKASDVGSSVTFTRARNGESEAVLRYVGSRIGLHKFTSRVRTVSVRSKNGRYGYKRKQTRVKVHKKDALTPAVGPNGNAGFTGPDGRVYARVGIRRDKIVALMGPSIPQMVDKAKVIDPLNNMLSTELNEQFAHNLDFFMLQQMGLK